MDASISAIGPSQMDALFGSNVNRTLDIQGKFGRINGQSEIILNQMFKNICEEMNIEQILNGATPASTTKDAEQPMAEVVDNLRQMEANKLNEASAQLERETQRMNEEIAKMRHLIANEIAAMEEQHRKLAF